MGEGNRNMNNVRKANFTVECAIIMPIILSVIISVMWLMIGIYDRNIMYSALVHGVLAADYQDKQGSISLKNEIEKRIEEETDGRLFGVTDTEISVKVTNRKVIASVDTKLNVPINLPIISDFNMLSVKVSKRRMQGADLINDVRRIKALYDIINGLTEDGNEEESCQ